jgi:hypothetical protein
MADAVRDFIGCQNMALRCWHCGVLGSAPCSECAQHVSVVVAPKGAMQPLCPKVQRGCTAYVFGMGGCPCMLSCILNIHAACLNGTFSQQEVHIQLWPCRKSPLPTVSVHEQQLATSKPILSLSRSW